MVVFLAAPGFLAALFFLAAALGFLAAVFFLAMVFLTGDFFCGARQGAGQPSVRAHCIGSGGAPCLVPAAATVIARCGALDGEGRLGSRMRVQHSRRGTHRHARPSGFWPPAPTKKFFRRCAALR